MGSNFRTTGYAERRLGRPLPEARDEVLREIPLSPEECQALGAGLPGALNQPEQNAAAQSKLTAEAGANSSG